MKKNTKFNLIKKLTMNNSYTIQSGVGLHKKLFMLGLCCTLYMFSISSLLAQMAPVISDPVSICEEGVAPTLTATCEATCPDIVTPVEFSCTDPCDLPTGGTNCATCVVTNNPVEVMGSTVAPPVEYDAAVITTATVTLPEFYVLPNNDTLIIADLPPCCPATIVYTIDYEIDPSIPASSISWTSEAFFELAGPDGTTLVAGGPGLPGSANNSTPIMGQVGGSFTATNSSLNGNFTLSVGDTFDDAGADGTFFLTLSYEIIFDECTTTGTIACDPIITPSPDTPVVNWFDGSGALVGTGETLVAPVDVAIPGLYDFSATCVCGTDSSPAAFTSVSVNANPDKTISDIMHETCVGDGDGSAVITVTNAGSPVDPTTAALDVTAIVTGPTPSTTVLTASGATFAAEVSGLAPGVYTVLLEDALGCTSDEMDFEIFAAPVFEPTCTVYPEICKDDNNGAIEFATNYVVAGPARTLTISLESNGAAIQTDPYTAGSTMTYTNLADGLYTIRVVDNLGCEYTEDKNIEPGYDKLPPVTTNVTICQYAGDNGTDGVPDLTATTDGSCAADGSAETIRWYADAGSTELLGTGPNFNPVTQGGADPSVPGMICFWVECGCNRCDNAPNNTNPSGCDECTSVRVSACFMVSENPQIDLDVVANESCPGAADGSVFVDGHDGTAPNNAPFIYGLFSDAGLMTSVATSPSTSDPYQFTGLAAGVYYATFVDAAGAPIFDDLNSTCRSVVQFEILSAADNMFDSFDIINESCGDAADGQITINTTPGAGYVPEYSINDGFGGSPWQTNNTFSNLEPGVYAVSVRNQNAIDCVSELGIAEVLAGDPIPAPTTTSVAVCLDNPGDVSTALTADCSAVDCTSSIVSNVGAVDVAPDGVIDGSEVVNETFSGDFFFATTAAEWTAGSLIAINPTVPANNIVVDANITINSASGTNVDDPTFGTFDEWLILISWDGGTTWFSLDGGTNGSNTGTWSSAATGIAFGGAFNNAADYSAVGNETCASNVGENCDLLGQASVGDCAGGFSTYNLNNYPVLITVVDNSFQDGAVGSSQGTADLDVSVEFFYDEYTPCTPCTVEEVLCAPPGSAGAGVTWWNSPVFGSNVTSFDTDGVDETFDPVAAGLVNPSIPGTYTFYAQCECLGCFSERIPATITILEELAAPEITGPTALCAGETATFSITDDGNMYTWTLNGVDVGTGTSVDITFDGATITNTIAISATDADGCMSTSSLVVTQEVDNAMFCNPSANVSVGEDCAYEVTPFTTLKNALYDESSYQVAMITNNSTGEVVYNAAEGTGSTTLTLDLDPDAESCSQNFTITVEHLCSGNRCSGDLLLEDKTPPSITCPSLVDVTEFTTLTGELTADDPTYNRIFLIGGTDCVLSGVGQGVSYDAFEFQVDAEDVYTFTANFVGDGTAAIYEGSFNPNSPCVNLVAYDDDGAGNLDPLIMTTLLSSGTYVLVTSTFSPGDFGEYDWAITSENGGTVFQSAETTLLCTEFDDIFTPDETPWVDGVTDLSTGNPTVSDNCSNWTVTYSDASVGTSCALSILRTFTVTDACGNVETCTQTINFTNPDLADVVFPNLDDVECDGSGLDQAHPDVIGGYPVHVNPVTGVESPLNDGLCNINLTWTDQVLEQCGASYKVLREWTVLDWCAVEAGAEETYVQGAQIIFVTDTTGPEITCATQQVYAANPFECEAIVTIPSISYVDLCSGISETIDNNGFPRDPATGNNSQNGDVDNDRVWYVNGDEAVDLQGFTISVTVDGAPYTLFDNNGSSSFQGSQLPTDSNGDRILVDVTNGKPFEAQMGDQIRLVGTGDHEIVYSVTDNCGNTSTCTSIITIEDQSAPNPICDENTVAVLGNDGTATICWETFDDGSFDNCDDVIIRVKRMDDPLAEFSECVDFDCADLQYDDACPANVNGVTQVRMRVYQAGDAGLLSYEDNENAGILWNECMINVEVQDKQAPAIICPPDKFLECMDDYTVIDNVSDNPEDGPEVFMDGTLIGYYNGPIIDNCNNHEITLSETGSVDGCGEGDIYRTYTITDLTTCASHSCVQRINVSKTPDQFFLDGVVSCDLFENNITSPSFVNGVVGDVDRLIWPSDKNINCASEGGAESTDPAFTDRPTYSGEDDDCHNLLQGYEDKFHYNDPNNCYTILRTWSVYDWCQYDPNSGSCQGVWTHVQVINVNDDTPPVITCGDDVTAEANSAGCATGDGCSGTISLPVEAEDACGGEITFTYEIDAFWDGVNFNADITGEGLADGEYPEGKHRIRYTAEDACGNTSSCMYTFDIIDVKAPTPICVALNSVTMDESGSLEMWASDFESGSSCDNCTLYENLQWRIRKANDPTPLPADLTADDLPSAVTFTCADGEIGGNEVHIYLFDEAGNYDFCLTGINIIPGNDDCLDGGPEMLNIAGHIETEDTDMVQDVNVDVSGMSSSIFTTGTNGLFNFLNAAAPGGNYVVTPEKDVDFLNGVTTFDLVLISQHILGVQTLDSPYKIIAADANKSNTVTTLDLVKLQRLILNIDSDLAPNTSWRFVDMDHSFGNPANPFDTTYPAFPEVININNMSQDEMDADFVGVKIGDVNGSATPNMVLGSATRNIDGNLTLVANEMSISRGEAFTVDFTADNFENVLGYQFTLDFDTEAMDMVEIIPGTLKGLTTDNFGLAMLNDGIITTSWHNAKTVSVESSEVLFSIEFKAISDLKLSDVISISSEVTKAEAYNGDAQLLDVDLGINTENGVITSASFELLQNSPNPFKGETLIGFTLPTATPATLSIMDVSGKILKRIEGDFVQGYNEVKLYGGQFEGAGVLYYQLDTPTDTATKKMILID